MEIKDLNFEEIELRFLSLYGTKSNPTKAAKDSCNVCGRIVKKRTVFDECFSCFKKIEEERNSGKINTGSPTTE